MLFYLIYVGLFIIPSLANGENASIRNPITPSFYSGVINLSDLNTSASALGAMYTINLSGRYYVSSDLSINPDNNQVAAIQITADNVFLDLNSTTIFQQSGNSATGLMGIEIASNVSNVHIKNGFVSGLNVADSTEENAGIFLRSSASNILIEDVSVSGCTSATNEVSAFRLDTCNNIKLVRCTAGSNTNTLAVASSGNGSVTAFYLDSCNSCVLDSCIAIKNSSTDEHSLGFRLETCNFIHLKNCAAYNLTSTSNNSGSRAAGYHVSGGDGSFFENCAAMGMVAGTASDSLGIGFEIDVSAQYMYMKNCIAQSNSGGSGVGYGLRIDVGTEYCTIEGCSFLNNIGAATGYGVGDSNPSSTNIYISNIAHGNGKSDGSVVRNYVVSPSGGGGFPVKGGTYSNYSGLDSSKTGYFSVEIS